MHTPPGGERDHDVHAKLTACRTAAADLLRVSRTLSSSTDALLLPWSAFGIRLRSLLAPPGLALRDWSLVARMCDEGLLYWVIFPDQCGLGPGGGFSNQNRGGSSVTGGNFLLGNFKDVK